jgi:hypothetical protein
MIVCCCLAVEDCYSVICTAHSSIIISSHVAVTFVVEYTNKDFLCMLCMHAVQGLGCDALAAGPMGVLQPV